MPTTPPVATFRTSGDTNAAVRGVIGHATAERAGRKPSADAVIAAAIRVAMKHWPEFLVELDQAA